MKTLTTFERLMPTTVDGHIIKVTTYYSSFDKEAIDALEKEFAKTIGTALVSETVSEEEARKAESEADAEAKREMYKLDDNEDTLKWKGTH